MICRVEWNSKGSAIISNIDKFEQNLPVVSYIIYKPHMLF